MDKALLKLWITRKGITQKTLAKELGLTENTVSLKVNNKVSITTDEATKICELLNIYDLEERAKIFLI